MRLNFAVLHHVVWYVSPVVFHKIKRVPMAAYSSKWQGFGDHFSSGLIDSALGGILAWDTCPRARYRVRTIGGSLQRLTYRSFITDQIIVHVV